MPPTPASLEVAERRGDAYVPLEQNLRKLFEDGGTIESFAIELSPDGPFLVRAGKELDGRHRTEWIPLLRQGMSNLAIRPDVVWYYVCRSQECLGCRANAARTTCECPGGGTCVFGIESSLFPTEVLEP